MKLPVVALLYQQHNNHWLRKLAWGREVYLVPVGDLAGVVFATKLLSQLRSRGIDLDRVSQHHARQEGKTLDKTGNTKFAAQLIAEHIQNWLPSCGTDPESQHEITSLRAEVAKLKQQLGEPHSDPLGTWHLILVGEYTDWTLSSRGQLWHCSSSSRLRSSFSLCSTRK